MRLFALLLAEARRRRVFRTAGLYIVGAWVVLQVADLLFDAWAMPPESLRYLWLAALAGFPLALLFGWYYDVSADGIRRTPPAGDYSVEELAPRVPDYILIVAVAIVAGIGTGSIFERVRDGGEAAGASEGIAVLPLENMSGSEDQAYFSAGMHDALITSLSRLKALRVVSRTSTLRLDPTLTVPEIGQKLGVRHVIEGSVTREGDRVRIIVQLIDAASDAHVWADSFERELTGVLALQNEMARAIAAAIDVQLSAAEQAVLGGAPQVNAATYDDYMRGMYLVNQPTTELRRSGIAILEEVVERDPSNALAYAGLAYGYAILGHSPLPEGMYPASKLASARALALDDSLPEAHLSVAMLKMYYEWDFPAARESFERAIELNPNLADAYMHYAWLYEIYRDSDRALPLGDKSASLNPLSPLVLINLGGQYWAAGRYDDALRYAEATLDLDPASASARWLQSMTFASNGDFERAISIAESIRDNPAWGYIYGVVLARSGRTEEARRSLEAIEQSPQNVMSLIMLNAVLGETDEALRWLIFARDLRVPFYPWFLTWFPETAELRGDPRMQELAGELGLQDYL